MASTTFVDNQTVIYAAWLNDVNNAVYNGVFVSTTLTATNMICTGTASGVGFTNLINNTFSSPAAIGSATPNTGAFTTLSATTSLTLNSVPVVTTTGTQTLTNKTLTSPTISSPTITSPTISGAVVSTMASSVITSGTTVASTSGTSIDFTSIPSWVKKITVMFNGVSTSGTSDFLIQLGSGSVETTGYTGRTYAVTTATSTQTIGATVTASITSSACLLDGAMTLVLLGSNLWILTGLTYNSTEPNMYRNVSKKTLSGALDRVRITTVNGTDTFDAGSINILYE